MKILRESSALPLFSLVLVAVVAATSCGRTPPFGGGGEPDPLCDLTCAEICARTIDRCPMIPREISCMTRCATMRVSAEMRCLEGIACQGSSTCADVDACLSSPKGVDLTIRNFLGDAVNRSLINYRAEVCNDGNVLAQDIEVSFYLHSDEAPKPGELSYDRVKISFLAPGQCEDVGSQIPTHRALVRSWVQVDPGQKISELREDNNVKGPLIIDLVKKVGPDLVIQSFDVYPGDKGVTFIAKVCNFGSTPTVGYTHIDFYEDEISPPGMSSLPDLSESIPPIAPKVCHRVKVFDSLSSGSYHAWAYINRTRAVEEANYDNNISKRRDFVVGGKLFPDLYVKVFDVYPWKQNASYVAMVCNLGNADAKASLLEVFHQPIKPDLWSKARLVIAIPSIARGRCESVKSSHFTNPGTYMAWGWINRKNDPVESDKGNNIIGPRKFTISGGGPLPDLFIKSLTAATSAAGKTTYSVQVCNQGSFAAPPATLRIFYDRPAPPSPKDKADLFKMLPSLGGMACTSISLVGSPKAGKNLSWAAVDLEDKIRESNEKNNTASVQILVSPAPNACDAACALLVDPCHFLPQSQLGSCVINCKSLPQSKIDCAAKATQAKDCAAVDKCIFS